jgi:hypothetical protein
MSKGDTGEKEANSCGVCMHKSPFTFAPRVRNIRSTRTNYLILKTIQEFKKLGLGPHCSHDLVRVVENAARGL